MLTELSLLTLFVGLMAIGAWLDLVSRRLPNWLCLLVFATGIGATWMHFGVQALPLHALHFAIAFAIGILLYWFGVIGGGDAKFYAAAAMWFSLSDGLRILLCVSLFGVLLLIVMVGWNTVRRNNPANKPKFWKQSVPYGVAIAFGASTIAILNSLA